MKRLLDCTATDFAQMGGRALVQAIKASEGRVVLSEVIGAFQPLYPPGASNAEVAAAFGADMVLLNFFDLFQPLIQGIETERPEEIVTRLKRLIGRPVGVNLEPVDPSAKALEQLVTLPEGRTPTKKTLEKVIKLGFDFICLTGNPKTGVTKEQITRAVRLSREVLGADMLIIAGKMHGAGVAGESSEDIFSQNAVQSFIEAGADIILLPAPGTVPGITAAALQEQIASLALHKCSWNIQFINLREFLPKRQSLNKRWFAHLEKLYN
ncbi:haloacid dehalogenase-like hydrolase [Siminovitchia fortis]|nr:haloacid dehalogenase-like hydrolase [Siminovitchia fortis]WHY81228.1 haloacid dehalogenase-like hydrolase [Siminovitchia fortis]